MNRLNSIIRISLICSIFSLSLFEVSGQNDTLEADSSQRAITPKKTIVAAPVVPFHDTLFYIKNGMGSFSSHDRANSLSDRIRSLSKREKKYCPDTMRIICEDDLFKLLYHDFVVISITEADARIEGKTQSELIREYEKIIKDAIEQRQKDTKWQTIVIRIFWVLLIIGIQYLLIRVLNHFFRKIDLKVDQMKGKKIKTLKFKSYTLMDENKTIGFIHILFKILRYIIILVMLYLSVPMALHIFPATRGLANLLFGYIVKPFSVILNGIVGFIPNLIMIVVIIFIFRYIIKMLRFFTDEIYKNRLKIKGFYPDWAYPTFNIIRIVLYAIMFVMIWNYLPWSDSKIFQGVTVFIGIVFSLGSTSVVNNMVSGFVITYMRPFKQGDRIKIGDIVGNVVEKTPLVTRIRTPKNEEITIPNSNIMSAQTYNYTYSANTYGLILHTTVTMGYETPWRKVHQMLLEAAKRTPDVLETPNPFILQTALDDFYANYQLNVYIKDADKMALIYSLMLQNIQDVFSEEGVELMSPHYLSNRDGNQTTVPASYVQSPKL